MYGGGGRIRTIEGGAGRFTVCSLWPLGNPSRGFLYLESVFPTLLSKCFLMTRSQETIWWRGTDSNHRRRSRQIYSLLPLATREPLQGIFILRKCFPNTTFQVLSHDKITRNNMVEGDGFEPSKAEPADLQSAPFGHSGTPPGIFILRKCFPNTTFQVLSHDKITRRNMVEGDGFEPSKAEPADLQSAPFGHSGTPPGCFSFH